MEPLTAIIVSRAIERTTGVLIGGLCIYLGWKLFALHQGDSNSEIVAGWKSFKITLKRLAPGAIFAAFGAAVVATSFFRGVSFNQSQTDAGLQKSLDQAVANSTPTVITETKKQIEYQGFQDTAGLAQARANVVLLNQILRLVDTDSKKDSLQFAVRLEDIQKQRAGLVGLRDRMIVSRMGAELTDLWKARGDIYRLNPAALSEAERRRLAEIEPWYSTTAAPEGTP